MRFPRVLFALAPALVLVASPSAGVAASPGGASADAGPTVSAVRCVSSAQFPCPAPGAATPGGGVQIRGRDLAQVRSVTFRGGPGTADDVVVEADHARATHVEAVVPAGARTGRLEVRGEDGAKAVSRTPVRVAAAAPATGPAAPGSTVFPIRGKHDLGQTATNGWGGGRNHKGQDMFAACGTPVAVAEAGVVRVAKFDGRAGNFAVITGAATGRDLVYMHMQRPAKVTTGQQVAAGQPLGQVGDTGNATGCHVHFEIWSAPGWYAGGAPMDALPDLTAWDGQDPAHKH